MAFPIHLMKSGSIQLKVAVNASCPLAPYCVAPTGPPAKTPKQEVRLSSPQATLRRSVWLSSQNGKCNSTRGLKLETSPPPYVSHIKGTNTTQE